MTEVEQRVLYLLRQYKELDTWSLAEKVGVTRPTMRSVLKSMEKRALVKRTGKQMRLKWLTQGGRDPNVPPVEVQLWKLDHIGWISTKE